MNGPIRRAARDDDGQIAILVAIMFLGLVFAVALVVNTGLLFVERRSAQSAADGAALAGALSLVASGSVGTATTTATQAASLNGFSGAGVVTVNIPPTSGPHAANSNFVEVLIHSSASAILLPDWGITSVNARAVAGGGGSPSQAIYALGGSGTGLSIKNGGVLGLYNHDAWPGCSYDPSSVAPGAPWVSPTGQNCASFGGNAQIDSTSSNSAAVSNGSPGGVIGPTGTVSESVVGCTTPPPPDPKFPGASCIQPSLSDPFYPFPKPRPDTVPSPPSSPNWCREDTSNLNSLSPLCATYSGNINGCASSLVLQPGIYTGKISGSCDYIFKPGIYIFATDKNNGISNPSSLRVLGNTPGDTFELVAGQQGLPGASAYHRDAIYGACGNDASPANNPRCGVLMFFTYSGYPAAPPPTGAPNCAQMGISGGNTADLAPESTGTWQGMLVYYDAYGNGSYCDGSSISVGGGAALNGTSFRGLIYAPKANLVMNGNTSVAVLSQLVVNSIDVQNALVVVNVGTAQILTVGGLRLTE